MDHIEREAQRLREKQPEQVDNDSMTLTRFLLHEQKKYPHSTGDFTRVLQSIQLACKVVGTCVRRAGIGGFYGLQGTVNKTMDQQKKLDVIADETWVNALRSSFSTCVLVSEEQDEIVSIDEEFRGKYIVTFDPLDGSSNIDCLVSIGSIFGIFEKKDPGPISVKDALQKGTELVAAGYCLYSSAVCLVVTTGHGVNGFTYDPTYGEFLLTDYQMTVPNKGTYYSCNEGNSAWWDPAMRAYVEAKKTPNAAGKTYSARYIGSMVADVHRTLRYGGIFMYPSDCKQAKGKFPGADGKLRLLYEGAPMAKILEEAGGKALCDCLNVARVLDVQPNAIHQRVPIYLGSPGDIDEMVETYQKMRGEVEAWRKDKFVA